MNEQIETIRDPATGRTSEIVATSEWPGRDGYWHVSCETREGQHYAFYKTTDDGRRIPATDAELEQCHGPLPNPYTPRSRLWCKWRMFRQAAIDKAYQIGLLLRTGKWPQLEDDMPF